MTDSMIERVARALVRMRGALAIADDDAVWTEEVARYRALIAQYPDYADARSLMTDAFRDARTCVAAMREPVGAMLGVCLCSSDAVIDSAEIAKAWRAMIDIALAE